MESGLMEQGLALMLVGMGTVFVFLTLLVASMSAMSAAVARFAPPPSAPPSRPTASEDPAIIAAIVAAVDLHRRGGRSQ